MISKVNEPFNMRLIDNFEVSSLVELINSYDKEWLKDTRRQQAQQSLIPAEGLTGYPHKDTNNIYVYNTPRGWKEGDKYATILENNDSILNNMVLPIISKLEAYHSGKVGKVLFIKLPAGKNILSHVDAGDYFEVVRRHHIPITTNLDTTFTVGKETINMKVGECWEINNNHTHSVSNKGNSDRVHLLVDIVPDKYVVL